MKISSGVKMITESFEDLPEEVAAVGRHELRRRAEGQRLFFGDFDKERRRRKEKRIVRELKDFGFSYRGIARHSEICKSKAHRLNREAEDER